jgi:hypothetical protein
VALKRERRFGAFRGFAGYLRRAGVFGSGLALDEGEQGRWNGEGSRYAKRLWRAQQKCPTGVCRTFLDSAGNGVFTVDTVGRVRVSRERREQLLREFAKSGISARRFAQPAGVKPVTFYSRVQKQRASGAGAPLRNASSPVSFMEAVSACPPAVPSGSESPLVVHLGGAARAEVANNRDIPLLAQLLAKLSLSKSCPPTHA